MLRPESQSSRLMPCYARLEEALKSWHQIVANELVHFVQLGVGNGDPFALISEMNNNLDRWIELEITLRGQREAHYAAIIRPARDGKHIGWASNLHLGYLGMERYPAMFIDVPKPVQTPQFSRLISIPTVVWLKRLDDVHGGLGNTLDGDVELPTRSGIVDAKYGKTGPLILNTTSSSGEPIGEVIQRAAKTSHKVSNDQSHHDCDRLRVEAHNVLAMECPA